MQSKELKVTILGAGIIGLICAHLLTKIGVTVTIIEAKDLEKKWSMLEQVKESRYTAISAASKNILEKIDIWHDFSKKYKNSYQKMCVWDDKNNEINFNADDISFSSLGYIVENHALQKVLWNHLKLRENINIISPANVKSLFFADNTVTLELSDLTKITSDLLIGAEGQQSWVREQMGIKVYPHNYHQVALSAKVVTERPHQQTAWQCFSKKGIIAFLPLVNPHHCSIVWTVNEHEAATLFSLPDEKLSEKIANAFQHRLGQVTLTQHKQIFPLQRIQASAYVKERVVLLGDAAHIIHPMVGQGMNLGIINTDNLVRVIQNAIEDKQDIGQYTILRKYERESKYRTFKLMMVIAGLKTVFESEHFGVSLLKKIGLQTTSYLPIVKEYMMRYATGALEINQGDIDGVFDRS